MLSFTCAQQQFIVHEGKFLFFKKLVLVIVNNNSFCTPFTLNTLCDEYKFHCSSSTWANILWHKRKAVVLTRLTFPLIQIKILLMENMHKCVCGLQVLNLITMLINTISKTARCSYEEWWMVHFLTMKFAYILGRLRVLRFTYFIIN